MNNHKKYITEFFGNPDAEDVADDDIYRSQAVAQMYKDEEVAEEYGDLDDMTRYVSFKQKVLDKYKARDIKELSKINKEEFYIVRDHLQTVMDNIDFNEIRMNQNLVKNTDMDAVLDDLTQKRLKK